MKHNYFNIAGKCDLCGSLQTKLLFNRGRNNETVINVVCLNCGLVFIIDKKASILLEHYYSQGGFSSVARGSLTPSEEKYRQTEAMALNRFLRLNEVIPLIERYPGSVMEIGCGAGSFLRLMKGAGWRVKGIEPDVNYANAGVERYGVDIETTMFENYQNSDDQFDMICLFHTLEHVPSPMQTLDKINSHLAFDGILYVEVPCIERPYGGNLDEFFWSDHLFTFSANTLVGYFNYCGFENIKHDYTKDFLWIIGKKISQPLHITPKLPLDLPEMVIDDTARSYRLFRKSKYSLKTKLYRSQIYKKLSHVKSLIINLIKNRIDRNGVKANSIKRYVGNNRASASHDVKKLVHFGLHKPGNAGDTLLVVAVRETFDNINNAHIWELRELHTDIDMNMIKRINKHSNGILIGGGGLLLSDTNPNNKSGWQWACSSEMLEHINVPLIIFAIGYNRFRDQDEFAPVFYENINKVIRKSIFFGLRNHGSIRRIESYLDSDNRNRISFQPCPTTLLSILFPNLSDFNKEKNDKIIGINFAFDRYNLRFGPMENEILSKLCSVLKRFYSNNWNIRLIDHVGNDNTIIPWLIRERIQFEEVRINSKSYIDVIKAYADVTIAIGMRGHSQMIPFGLGKPIVSIITHDKLRYFLEDIGHEEWGIDVRSDDLDRNFYEAIHKAVNNKDEMEDQIAEAKEKLWETTKSNLKEIRANY